MLRELGYYNGVIDGYLGKATRDAVRNFQRAAGLGVDGVPGEETIKAIEDALANK